MRRLFPRNGRWRRTESTPVWNHRNFRRQALHPDRQDQECFEADPEERQGPALRYEQDLQ